MEAPQESASQTPSAPVPAQPAPATPVKAATPRPVPKPPQAGAMPAKAAPVLAKPATAAAAASEAMPQSQTGATAAPTPAPDGAQPQLKKKGGPVTDFGKAASAQNALKHGLTSPTLLLACEDRAEFQAFSEAMVDAFAPRDVVESEFVRQIIMCMWKLRRRDWLETHTITLLNQTQQQLKAQQPEAAQGEPMSEQMSVAEAMMADLGGKSVLDKVQRYCTTISRELERTMAQLRQYQKTRAALNQPAPEDEDGNGLAA